MPESYSSLLAKKIGPATALMLLMAAVSLWLLGCGGDNEDITSVKNSKINACATKTIGQMVDGFILKPKWESFNHEKGTVVNVSGKVNKTGEEVTVLLQFIINGKVITTNALNLNNEPQNQIVIAAFFMAMCRK
jgi:hypothetical protein